MPSILVTGANGQLGSELRVLCSETRVPGSEFVFVDRDELDLSDRDEIEKYFDGQDFSAIVNCAAYTAVDKAENEPEPAEAVNHLAVETLAHIAKDRGIRLIHISTDYVFDGKNDRPYTEEDPTDPQSVYGATKLAGEKAIQRINPKNSIIIRTSWVYSSFGNNFVKTMLRLGKERDELGIIYDQIGTPTYARDLAATILEILRSTEHGARSTEIYHYSNEGVASWYDFAKAIFEHSGIECRINPIETKDYPTPAARPHYSLLNKAKIKNQYNITIPYWRDSLVNCLQELREIK